MRRLHRVVCQSLVAKDGGAAWLETGSRLACGLDAILTLSSCCCRPASRVVERGLLLKVVVLHAWRGNLGHGLLHLCLVLEPAAQSDQLAEEGVAFLALIYGRVLNGLAKELLRMIHDLDVLMLGRVAKAQKSIQDNVASFDDVTIFLVLGDQVLECHKLTFSQCEIELCRQV